jgi:hypothetical protein
MAHVHTFGKVAPAAAGIIQYVVESYAANADDDGRFAVSELPLAM